MDVINASHLPEDTKDGEELVTEKGEALKRTYFLSGKTVAISVSESENLKLLGYGDPHVNDAVVEIARYVLALGGKLAYGGDMRKKGYTELIFHLLSTYKADRSLHPNERFHSYLAYPIFTELSEEQEASLIHSVSFKRIAPPDDLGVFDTSVYLEPNSPENLYVWSRCLTKMREEMESNCDARIFIGGKTRGFLGKCPGVLEELLLAIKHSHPVYIVGAFGGISKEIIKALSGESPECFSDEYHTHQEYYRKFVTMHNGKHPDTPIDYSEYLRSLNSYGWEGISDCNGLSLDDNRRLAETPHISEMVFLILKGLTNRFSGQL